MKQEFVYFTRLGLTSKVESQTSKNSFRGEYPDAFYFALYCIGSDYEGQYCCSSLLSTFLEIMRDDYYHKQGGYL